MRTTRRPRRSATIAMATLIAAAPMVAAANPASAAAYTCPRNSVCLFQDANFGGGHWTILHGDVQPNFNGSDPTRFSNGVKVNDNVSSFINTTGYAVKLCTDRDYSGVCDVWHGTPSVASNPGGHGDQYSSINFNIGT